MSRYERYQQVVAVPSHHLRWNLYGAGLENLGRNGAPESLPTPQPSDHQILVRIDAVGICFSDLKILRLGGDHPKIARNLQKHPVVMGHEIACTVAQVGSALRERFRVGERYLVQADVYVGGRVQAVGYALEGGYTQYALMTEAVLNGDAGCYLLPCPSHLSYAEGALVEPWACIVASYQIAPRTTPKPNGNWLVVIPHAPYIRYACKALESLVPTVPISPHPPQPSLSASREGGSQTPLSHSVGEGHGVRAEEGGMCLILHDAPAHPLVAEFIAHAERLGMQVHTRAVATDHLYNPEVMEDSLASLDSPALDDILLYGNPTPELIEWAIDHLAYGGHLSFTCHHRMAPVPVDVGRLHYDRLMVMGTTSWNITDAYHYTRSTEIRGGDRILLFGAGGPMGQMQLHYALSRPNPPAQVVVVDRHPERLEPLRTMGMPLAQERGIDLQFYCNAGIDPDTQSEQLRQLCPHGFDQIMLLASSPEAVAHTYPLLTDGGVMNLFAGIPKGAKVPLDLTLTASRHMRIVGSSGSTLDDMARCIELTASGELPTRRVVAAVGGLNTLHDALRAVAEHRYLGKVVLYPHLPDMPLMGLRELPDYAPEVALCLEGGLYWTREAEAQLFERFGEG